MTEVNQQRKTLDFNEKQKTSYCISSEQRDEQIKIALRKVKDRVKQESMKEESCAVIGYGPSLNNTWEEVKKFPVIFTCSGAHKFLIEKGLKPSDFKRWVHVDLEPRGHKVKLLGEPQKGIEYKIASTIAPNYLDKLQGFDVALWHIFATEDESIRILPPGEIALTGGSDVGMRTMVLARFLGYKDLHIFGIDGNVGLSGFHAAEHPNQPPYDFETELNGRKFYTTPALLQCAKQMPYEVDQLVDITVKFYGDGLVQEIMKDYVRNPKAKKASFIAFDKPELISEEYKKLNIELHESNIMYGMSGGKHADTVKKLLKTLVTEEESFPSCLDYGCGKGALGKALNFPIFEYDPAIPGKEETPKPADLVVCTDVLEHIEPDKLEFVLGDLRRCVKRIGYFVISTRQAVKKYSNGQNAHLIVKGKDWWRAKLSKHFLIPENGVSENKEQKELHVIVAPKPKEEKKQEEIIELHGIKFYIPNELTKWRAETLLVKEPCTTEWIKKMEKGSILFDVGACIGSYSLLAGVNKVKVYSFEPEPENFSILSKNLEINNIQANAFCLAIGDKKEVGELYVSRGGAGQSCHSFNSPSEYSKEQTKVGCLSMTLDELIEMGLPHPDYIKIDVDGFEYKVIKGATNTLKKGVKELLVEVNTKNPEHNEMVKYIASLGYTFDQIQVDKAKRKSGTFEGVAEYIFTKKTKKYPPDHIVSVHSAAVVDDYIHYTSLPAFEFDNVKNAKLQTEPYPYMYLEGFFHHDIYQDILKDLKTIDFVEIEKSRGTKGYPLRYTGNPPKYISDFLMNGAFKQALLSKFGIPDGDYIEDILLVRDLPGYSIPPHTDSLRKVITVLIYLPENKSMEQEGTSIFTPKKDGFTCQMGQHHKFEDFDKVRTMPFRPNSMFAFARTNNSFHGVEPSRHVRNVLLYNINRK